MRLAGAKATPWVSDFPIDALGAACEMLGVSRSFGKEMTLGALTQTQLATATSAGFSLLDQGADALGAYFETLRYQSGTPQDRPQSRYGRIYDWLKRGAGSGSAFAPIRDLLRDHILQTWPLGPGEQALDFRVVERRLHSIRTAAKTFGLHPKRLRRILMDAAVISETDAPDAEVIFRVGDVGDILEQASAAVSLASAQKRLAMTRSQMETLIRAGLLKPGEGGDAARPRFTEASIQHWSDFFASFPPAGLFHSLTSIADAARSLGTSTDIILGLIIDKRLGTVQKANGLIGFACLLINQAEAAKLLTAIRGMGTSQSLSSLASAIRISPKSLRMLAEAGYFTLIECIDARTNQPVTRVSDEDVTQFSTDYISLRKFVGSSRLSQFVRRDLLAREIWPVFTCPEQKEFLYRREDLG